MKVYIYNTGVYDVNTYLVVDEVSKESVIIDIGGKSEKLIKDIQNYNLKYILNTHGHFDHISGEYEFQQYKMLPTYIHKSDNEMVSNLENILKSMGFPPQKPPIITNYLDETTELSIGEKKIKVIETSGHTKGSVSFLIEDSLFSGDTLFYGSYGRTDFPGGSFAEIKNSILNELFILDENTTVYPGHGPQTTIGYEKLNNAIVL